MENTWAIIGGGNGGQTIAGHLGILGQKVRLFDIDKGTIDKINEKGGITLNNAIQGFGRIEFATDNIRKAIVGADIVMVTLPSIYHKDIAIKCAPYLEDGQIVLLHPEASCGALAFRKVLKDLGCLAEIILGATNTLLYSCRAVEPGNVVVYGMKKKVYLAALPASYSKELEEVINPVLPWFKMAPNVLFTSLNNQNALMHPAPMLLNTSRIEAKQDFEYYHEGITESIGRYVEFMDEERLALGEALDLKLEDIRRCYLDMYDCGDMSNTLAQMCVLNKAYEGIRAPKTLRTRYLLEDIPYSLCAMQALAEIADVSMPCIDAIVTLGRNILRGELDKGRTVEVLGIKGMTKEELIDYVS